MQIIEETMGGVDTQTLSPGTALRVNRMRQSLSKESLGNYVDLRKQSRSPSHSSAHNSSKRIVMQKQASATKREPEFTIKLDEILND